MAEMTMTLEDIRRKGYEALVRELGPVGMIRFLQQFETGRGDYTQERHDWLTESLEEIVEVIRERKKQA